MAATTSTSTAPAHLAQRRPHVAGVEGGAEAVLRRVARLGLVAAGRPVSAEVVPGRGLVAAPQRVPGGERDVEQATRARDAHLLVEEARHVGHVLEDVGGEGEVGQPVGERQVVAVARHRQPRRHPPGGDGEAVAGLGAAIVAGIGHRRVTRLGLDQEAAGPGGGEGLGEVAGAAAHVDHGRPRHLRVLRYLGHGVVGHGPVEGVGVGLLEAEDLGQGDRTAQARSGQGRGPPGRAGGGGRGAGARVAIGPTA